MFPWIVGLGALGLLAVAASSSSSSSGTAAAPPYPGGGLPPSPYPNVTPHNVSLAVSAALQHESDPSRLMQFADALSVYGDPKDAQALANKAAQLSASGGGGGGTPSRPPSPHPVATAPAPPPGPTKAPGPSTFTVAPPKPPTNASVIWWVNHYLGTNYNDQVRQDPNMLQEAVIVALHVETSLSMLAHYAWVMSTINGAQADYLIAQAATMATASGGGGSVTDASLQPFVDLYVGHGTKLSESSVRHAVATALLTETSASELQKFSSALHKSWADGAEALGFRAEMVAAGAQPIPKDLATKYPLTLPTDPTTALFWINWWAPSWYPVGGLPLYQEVWAAVRNAVKYEKDAHNLTLFGHAISSLTESDINGQWGQPDWSTFDSQTASSELLAQAAKV